MARTESRISNAVYYMLVGLVIFAFFFFATRFNLIGMTTPEKEITEKNFFEVTTKTFDLTYWG